MTVVMRPLGEIIIIDVDPTKTLPNASDAIPAGLGTYIGVPFTKESVDTMPENVTKRIRPLPVSATTRLLLPFTEMPDGE
jgi:hypothetical protein